jgi:hypothetical protein
MISRMSEPNTPATMTSTRSPGSITETAADSSAVRPEPGMTMTSPRGVWKISRRSSVTGSRIFVSKFRSYWIDGGWFIAWMTGHGSSVGPGIMRMARLWGTPQRMVGSMITLLLKGLSRVWAARKGSIACSLLPVVA